MTPQWSTTSCLLRLCCYSCANHFCTTLQAASKQTLNSVFAALLDGACPTGTQLRTSIGFSASDVHSLATAINIAVSQSNNRSTATTAGPLYARDVHNTLLATGRPSADGGEAHTLESQVGATPVGNPEQVFAVTGSEDGNGLLPSSSSASEKHSKSAAVNATSAEVCMSQHSALDMMTAACNCIFTTNSWCHSAQVHAKRPLSRFSRQLQKLQAKEVKRERAVPAGSSGVTRQWTALQGLAGTHQRWAAVSTPSAGC